MLWRSRVKLMKEVGRELTIDPDTGAKLLAVAKQPMKDVLMMIQDTGMRPEEVVRIRIENIDWRGRLIFNPNGKTKAAVWSNRKLGDGDECYGPLGCAYRQAVPASVLDPVRDAIDRRNLCHKPRHNELRVQ